MLGPKLQAIDADCEREAKIELAQLFENVQGSESNLRLPSPQAAEAIWLKLIARKEHAFIEQIDEALKEKSARPAGAGTAVANSDDIPRIEALIAELLDDKRYVDRMQDFYREAGRRASPHESDQPGEPRQRGFIDGTYRTGVTAALRKARRNILAQLESHKTPGSEDMSFSAQWKRYSTLSPWRLIWTIV